MTWVPVAIYSKTNVIYAVVMNLIVRRLASSLVALALGLVLVPLPVPSQIFRNFLQKAFETGSSGERALLGVDAPGFSLTIASRELEVHSTAQPNVARLTVSGIPLQLEMRYERQQGIDLYRIRHVSGSELRAEQVRFEWRFPDAYNESMTFDTGALQGQPLYLPDGTVPDNQFTNWGSLFYNREANLAVGTALEGAEMSRHARRGHSRFTRTSSLQLVTITGNPNMEIVLFAYHPKDRRFWWADWYQLRSRTDPNIPSNFFPILAPRDLSWEPGEPQTVAVVPAPEVRGQKMEMVIIDDIRQQIVSRIPFQYELPVTNVTVPAGNWPSSLYRVIVVSAGQRVEPTLNDLNRRLTNIIVRPRANEAHKGAVLFVAPTDAWWAYATNGSHDYHGWRTGYDGSVGYAPTVMSSRQHRMNNFFYSLYERFNDIYHFRYLKDLATREGFEIEFATQYDVALERVRLKDYRLVLIGNHCEFTTQESYRKFAEYMGSGGAVMIHGGDSFAVRVQYLPSAADPRYLWQRGHIWIHWSEQSSSFKGPFLLAPGALPTTPILNPTAGDAIDYLNPFHTTVGYWIPSSKAVIASPNHPILRGLNLKAGDEVPGPWGGEVDYLYEPQAWDILIRSDRAAPEEREFGVDAYDPTPLYRVGLAVHKNERLAVVSGENFPNILQGQENALFRELYKRTLLYLLYGPSIGTKSTAMAAQQLDATLFAWERPLKIGTLRYELPAFIDFQDPNWHRKPAPYAHYVVEGSIDGEHWALLVDRRHGPWRGMKTDFFSPAEVRYVRFDGNFSNNAPFHIEHLRAYQ
jgi:hypothetical protein